MRGSLCVVLFSESGRGFTEFASAMVTCGVATWIWAKHSLTCKLVFLRAAAIVSCDIHISNLFD
jgi:hypothetical protein